MISLVCFQDTGTAFAFLNIFTEHLKLLANYRLVVKQIFAHGTKIIIAVIFRVFTFRAEIGFSSPHLKKFAGFDGFLYGVGGKSLKLNVLDFTLSDITFLYFEVLRAMANMLYIHQ